MSKGNYTGGSTVIHAGSGWFGKSEPPATRQNPSIEELVASAKASAKRAEKRRAKVEAIIADEKYGNRPAANRTNGKSKKAAQTGVNELSDGLHRYCLAHPNDRVGAKASRDGGV